MKFSMEKRFVIPSVIALVLVLSEAVCSACHEDDRASMDHKEGWINKHGFYAGQRKVDSVEGKKSLAKVEGIVQALDELMRSLGLSQKVKSVKSTGTWDRKYGIEEEAEAQIEKVTMNEMANIFYKLENAPMILSISKTNIKTSFDNPNLLNITMTVSLIKPK
ncbi:MAG: hypothetical protein HQL08_15290 [Nitrospirae bacterium]|nr:hypothetical protein [Nitrospirota bacterium]